MDKDKAYLKLKELVEKYINNCEKKNRLLSVLSNKQYMPPVRGVIDDILKQSNQISKEDMDLIDDLMYFFGQDAKTEFH